MHQRQSDRDRTELIDLRGLKCPLPVLRLRKLTEGLATGTRLRVIASDPVAARDIPAFATSRGWQVEAVETGPDVQVFLTL